jgi:glutamate decarboxylase
MILVCAILGTTYTGQYKDIHQMDRLIAPKNKKEGLSVYIHVDAASGRFVAPFANPDLVWDFQLVCRFL